MQNSTLEALDMMDHRFLGNNGRSHLELSNAATIAWYCFLVSLATPAIACLGHCWYQKYRSHRRAMLALQRENELEQMSRIEANIQIFTESERMRRFRRIQVAMANQVRRLTTADLKLRPGDRPERMMKHDEQHLGLDRNPNDDPITDGDNHDDNCVDNDKDKEGATTSHACSICLEDFQLGESVAHSSNENCPHLFHEKCIISWLAERQDGFCPYCRRSFLCLPVLTSPTSIASQDQVSTVMEDMESGHPESTIMTTVDVQTCVGNGDESISTSIEHPNL